MEISQLSRRAPAMAPLQQRLGVELNGISRISLSFNQRLRLRQLPYGITACSSQPQKKKQNWVIKARLSDIEDGDYNKEENHNFLVGLCRDFTNHVGDFVLFFMKFMMCVLILLVAGTVIGLDYYESDPGFRNLVMRILEFFKSNYK